MFKDMLNKISIMTVMAFILTIAFVYLAITNTLSTEYITIYTMVVSFYFGSSAIKNNILNK